MTRLTLLVGGDGYDYRCLPMRGNYWRCGACKWGRLQSRDKKCKVCKRPVFKRLEALV